MATVDDVARAALGDLAVEHTALLLGVRWVNDRLAEFAGKLRLRQLRRLGELTIPAAITAGTVSVTQGSATVTGDATAAAAWSIALEGRFFKISRTWYRIATANAIGLTLTLEEPYSEDDATDSAYVVVARTVPLAAGCRTIVGFFHDRLSVAIEQRSLPWLDMTCPDRVYLATGPQVVADIGEDAATFRRLVEFYPYSDQPEHIRYAYYVAPSTLLLTDTIPSTVDKDALVQGVLASVMRWKKAKAADAGQMEAAALWRNEYRAQETKWEAVLFQRMAKSDTAMEDLAWLSQSPTRGGARSDITTARDEIYARGARP